MGRTLAVAALALLMAAAALGQVVLRTPVTRLASSGAWAAYTMPLELASRERRGVMGIDRPLCAAQVGSERSALLRVVFAPGSNLVVQTGSPSWSFRRRDATFSLRSETVLALADARYAENFVEAVLAADAARNGLVVLTSMARDGADRIEVLDRTGRVIVRFPKTGMAAMLARAERCAAPYWR